MIKATAVIVNSRGLHARPSSQLAKLASGFESKITVVKGKRTADAASISGLLMLVAPKNTELQITAKGKDEKEAVAAVLELIAGGFADGVDSPAVAENPPAIDAARGVNTQKIDGIGVGRGKVAGKAHIRRTVESETPQYHVADNKIAAEQKRFEAAVKIAQRELSRIRRKTEGQDGAADMIPFIDLYCGLLEDPALFADIRTVITDKKCNAEWAIQQRADAVSERFSKIDDPYLQGRGEDVRHVMRRLLAAMKPSRTAKPPSAEGVIIVATELDPAHVIALKERGYTAFITESGGDTSHAAILARSMEMPAVVGAKGVLAAVEEDDNLIMDMENDVVVVRPDVKSFEECVAAKPPPVTVRRPQRPRAGVVKTKDRCEIGLHANIELPDEVDGVCESPAGGVGLFRTEFLFMNRETPPEEDEQFEVYRSILRNLSPLPVVARTLDLGLDKTGGGMSDMNPLGMRAIRYCLAHPKIFLTQLRALLRAGKECRNLRILLPMLSHPAELEQTVALLNHAREQLRATRKLSAPLPPLGGMIEVPAAVFVMRAFARRLDFFSIGTNDLVQYALAADRGDERLARYYRDMHPAIVHLLTAIVDHAARAKKPVTLCGEMAGNPDLIRFLLALGLRGLSMSVPQIKATRDIIAAADCGKLSPFRRRALAAQTPEALRGLIEEINGTVN